MTSPKDIFESNKYSIIYAPYFSFFIFSSFVYLGLSIIIGNLDPLSWSIFLRVTYVFLEILIFSSIMKSQYVSVNKIVADGNELLKYLTIVFNKSVDSLDDSVSEDFIAGMKYEFKILLEELSKQITYTKTTQEEPLNET